MNTYDNLIIENFTPPWEHMSFSKRISILLSETQRIKIIYIHSGPECVTYRYRVHNMCEVLNASCEYDAVAFFTNELSTVLEYINVVDYVIVARVLWTHTIEDFIYRVKKKSIKIFFELDDLVFDTSSIPLSMNTLGLSCDEVTYNSWFAYKSRIELTAKLCDEGITTNHFLSERISKYFSINCHVAPNFLNEQQIEISNSLWEMKQANRNITDNDILIGYFSGTLSHNNDFGSIAPMLALLLDEYPQVKLRIVGFLELPNSLKRWYADVRIELLPLQNYYNLQVKIAECDINLIPLLINDFTHSKSEIKYLESAVVGVLSVASPTYIYKQCISESINGYLCNQADWLKRLSSIINDNDRQEIAARARKHALQNYFGQAILEKLKAVFK